MLATGEVRIEVLPVFPFFDLTCLVREEIGFVPPGSWGLISLCTRCSLGPGVYQLCPFGEVCPSFSGRIHYPLPRASETFRSRVGFHVAGFLTEPHGPPSLAALFPFFPPPSSYALRQLFNRSLLFAFLDTAGRCRLPSTTTQSPIEELFLSKKSRVYESPHPTWESICRFTTATRPFLIEDNSHTSLLRGRVHLQSTMLFSPFHQSSRGILPFRSP